MTAYVVAMHAEPGTGQSRVRAVKLDRPYLQTTLFDHCSVAVVPASHFRRGEQVMFSHKQYKCLGRSEFRANDKEHVAAQNMHNKQSAGLTG